MVDGDFTIQTSADGLRRTYARNAKCSLGGGRFDVVRVWRLAQRDHLKAKWHSVERQTGPKAAETFLATGVIVSNLND